MSAPVAGQDQAGDEAGGDRPGVRNDGDNTTKNDNNNASSLIQLHMILAVIMIILVMLLILMILIIISEAYKRGRIKRGCSQKPDLQIGGKTGPRLMMLMISNNHHNDVNANASCAHARPQDYNCYNCMFIIIISIYRRFSEFRSMTERIRRVSCSLKKHTKNVHYYYRY